MSERPSQPPVSRAGTLIALAAAVAVVEAAFVGRAPPLDQALALVARAGWIVLAVLPAELAWWMARRLPGLRGLCARAETAVDVATSPRAALGLLAAYAVAAVALGATVGRVYELPWHTGAFLALPALGLPVLLLARPPRAGALAAPHLAGRALLAAALIAIGVLVLRRFPDEPLPAAAALIGLVIVFPRWPLRRSAAAAGVGALAAAGVAIDALQPGLRRLEPLAAVYSGLGRALGRAATDLDGDGSSGWLGLDCDDRDPRRSPRARDVPDDGVDQNCTGADASFARALAASGVTRPRRPPPAAAARSIVVVVLDAWRADALAPSMMPETFAWAQRCVRFEQARADSSFTHGSLFALQTGLPMRHALHPDGDFRLIGLPRLGGLSVPPTMADLLRRAGYRTLLAAQRPLVDWFVQQGFDARVETARLGRAAALLPDVRKQAPPGPALTWVHLLDVHSPYPHSAREGYEAALRRVDASLARYLGSLRAEVAVLLTGDHGEAFGEHGNLTHSRTLFEEELRVPLVLCAPGIGPPRAVPAAVVLSDVVPTLLDLAGVATPYFTEGRSLLPALRGDEPWPERPLRFETRSEPVHVQAVLEGCKKLVRDLGAEWEAVFDLCADPGETVDRRRAEPDVAAGLHLHLSEWMDRHDAMRSWELPQRIGAVD